MGQANVVLTRGEVTSVLMYGTTPWGRSKKTLRHLWHTSGTQQVPKEKVVL